MAYSYSNEQQKALDVLKIHLSQKYETLTSSIFPQTVSF